jgi:ribosomal subunit interface protein
MSVPLQVTFHGVEKSTAAEDHVRSKADKLETLTHRIVGCRVAIEMQHRHGHGQHYRVAIDVKVPGGEVVATHAPHDGSLYSAIDAAFDAVGRQLHDLLDRQRGDTKAHARAE